MNNLRFLYLSVLMLCGLALPATAQQWSFRTAMDVPRFGIASAVLDGRIYVLGGEDSFGNVLATASRYDPVADRWDELPPMSRPRVFAAALASDGKIFVIGGRGPEGDVLDEVEFYDPAAGLWQPFSSMQEERQGLAAVLRGTRMFVAGGSDGSNRLLESIEIYKEGDGSGGGWIPFDEDETVEVEGLITALGPASITVAALTFVVTDTTEILDEDETPITLADLAVGMTVEVHGVKGEGDVLVATRIEVEDRGGPPELEFCASNINLNIGDVFNIRDYVQVKDDPGAPVDWSQVFFTYTEAGADNPTVPPDWNLGAFNAGQPVTVVAADAAPGTGNEGEGRYRVYVVRQGASAFDDALRFEVDNAQESEVEEAKCSGGQAAGKSAPFSQLGTPRAAFAAVPVDNRVLFLGGFGEIGPLHLVQQLDANGQLSDLTPLPTARGSLGAAVLGDSVLVLGGRDGSDRVLTDVLRLDPVSGTWLPMPGLNAARESFAVAVVDGAVFVIGGRGSDRVLGSVEVFGDVSMPTDAVSDPTPFDFRLAQNYPNPFPDHTTIPFSVSSEQAGRRVTLSVYDVQGRRIAVLVDGVLGAGRHEVTWDGRGPDGLPVGSGVYVYRVRQGDLDARKLMTIIH